MSAPTPSTLIDAVNERDEEVGTVLRGEALRQGQNFRTAHVFILNRNGCLLLQRLASQRERHPDRWGSSVAAYLFAGETYRDAAVRRMREELGVTAKLESVGKIEMQDLESLKFVSLFLAHADEAAIRDPAHIAQLKYWPIEEVEAGLETRCEIFTPTFVQLFRTFRDELR